MSLRPVTVSEIERKQKENDALNNRRRTVQKAVRDVREKITSSTGLNFGLEYNLAQEFAKNHISAAIALLPFTIIIAISTITWTTPIKAFFWLIITLSTLAYQYKSCRLFLSSDLQSIPLVPWVKKLIAGDVIFISSWALLPTIVGISETEVIRYFLLFSILITSSVVSVSSHTLPSAVRWSSIPVGIVNLQIFFDKLSSEKWMIAGLSYTALLLFIGLAQRLYATTLENMRARAEKDDLFAEVEQTNARLREATQQAAEASAAKSRFLATMSHELRTPLNAILGFSEVMKGELFGPLGNLQYKSYAADIHSSGSHLLEVINEVLDLSRIEAGKHELTEDAVDLLETVKSCCHMLNLRANSRAITIKTAFTQDMPRLWADERAIRQVTLNLLSNAIKFSPQGAEIQVRVGWTVSGGQYLLVKDNGPGVPEDEISVVLSTFGRGSRAIKNADQGSGLGLPIVKNLVELHGGQFVFKSKIREGTEVIAMFPPSRVMTAIGALPEKNAPNNKTPSRGTNGRAA